MNALQALRTKLTARNLSFIEGTDQIRVPPTNEGAFEITLTLHADAHEVAFAGWHETFRTAEEALDCIALGLSDRARLRVLYRGAVAYRWILEYKDDTRWIEDSRVGLFFYPFWRPGRERILQNHVLNLDGD